MNIRIAQGGTISIKTFMKTWTTLVKGGRDQPIVRWYEKVLH